MKKFGIIFLFLCLTVTLIYAQDNNVSNCELTDFGKNYHLLKRETSTVVANDNIGLVIKGFNGPAMSAAIGIADDPTMSKVNTRNAALLKAYLKDKCGIITDEDGVDSPEATLIFGLFQYGKENKLGHITQADMDNLQGRAAGDPFNCLVGAIGGVIGVGEVRELYNDYQDGVTASTILKTLKTMVRRVGSVFAVISAVYAFGDCLNWW